VSLPDTGSVNRTADTGRALSLSKSSEAFRLRHPCQAGSTHEPGYQWRGLYRGTFNAFGFLAAWRQSCFAGFVSRSGHFIKNNAIYLVLGLYWFHNK